jgi:hypothetical protein
VVSTRTKDSGIKTYSELSAHPAILAECRILQLGSQNCSKFDQARKNLAMREGVAEYIPQEGRAVTPNLIENIIIQRAGVRNQKARELRLGQT